MGKKRTPKGVRFVLPSQKVVAMGSGLTGRGGGLLVDLLPMDNARHLVDR